MKIHNNAHSCALIVAAVYGLVGISSVCAEGTHVDSPSKIGSVAQRSMTVTAPKKANGSGIDVSFRIDGERVSGVPITIIVSLAGLVPQAGASIRFASDAALVLRTADKANASLPADSRTATLSIQATPTSDGLFYIHVFTTQHGATSVTSIPVQVGVPASDKPKIDLQTAPDGEIIRTLPVR